ncbi:class I SAM-dependent methyltransferase [Jannaschia formosa]|uniref:class I SAM-dependent methyltransferase n=1 Tax=Jannaschia formosa TaxID=2259592 RepID=UPI001FD82183|nr:class I SAM-dependent methyltransferase [Jannaschia formosa]
MALLRDEGLLPHHLLLDIGAGALRLGCRAVPFLAPGNYWATDASRALMLRGRAEELADPAALDESRLVEDGAFGYPGVPDGIDYAIAFAVFPHLPPDALPAALARAHAAFPRLRAFLFTVFLAPEGADSWRQPDGVVTHAARAPRHLPEAEVLRIVREAGFEARRRDDLLPRGQICMVATPIR